MRNAMNCMITLALAGGMLLMFEGCKDKDEHGSQAKQNQGRQIKHTTLGSPLEVATFDKQGNEETRFSIVFKRFTVLPQASKEDENAFWMSVNVTNLGPREGGCSLEEAEVVVDNGYRYKTNQIVFTMIDPQIAFTLNDAKRSQNMPMAYSLGVPDDHIASGGRFYLKPGKDAWCILRADIPRRAIPVELVVPVSRGESYSYNQESVKEKLSVNLR